MEISLFCSRWGKKELQTRRQSIMPTQERQRWLRWNLDGISFLFFVNRPCDSDDIVQSVCLNWERAQQQSATAEIGGKTINHFLIMPDSVHKLRKWIYDSVCLQHLACIVYVTLFSSFCTLHLQFTLGQCFFMHSKWVLSGSLLQHLKSIVCLKKVFLLATRLSSSNWRVSGESMSHMCRPRARQREIIWH